MRDLLARSIIRAKKVSMPTLSIAKRVFLRTFVLLSSAVVVAPMAHAVTCESLAHLALSDTTITLAKSETTETYKPEAWKSKGPSPPPLNELPSFCRVVGEINPVPDSKIMFEVWMPISG